MCVRDYGLLGKHDHGGVVWLGEALFGELDRKQPQKGGDDRLDLEVGKLFTDAAVAASTKGEVAKLAALDVLFAGREETVGIKRACIGPD